MLTIEHPLTGAKLQVANQDFSTEMTWEEAKRACNELGSGWRLPTIEELKAMYEQLHRKGRGNFKDVCCWSSTESDATRALYFCLPTGDTYANNKVVPYSVRAVRAC